MKKKYPSQQQDKFTVRFPDGMRDKIAEIAAKNGRSMNNEIIYALGNYLSGETQDYLKKLEEIEKEVKDKLKDLRAFKEKIFISYHHEEK